MSNQSWDRLGAASGILSAALFGVAFVVFLGNNPTEQPSLHEPATAFASYVDEHSGGLRVALLLNSIAIVLFLWFLGSVRAALRAAEGGTGRVSAIASGGGLVGAAFVLLAFVFGSISLLDPGEFSPDLVKLLGTLDAMSLSLGAAAFTVFFLATAKVVLRDGGLPAAIGALALVAAATSALGFVTVFTDEGIFNAATGAFGFWVRYAVFVVWLFLASVALTAQAGTARRQG